MTKEQKFYKALQDVFIGAKIEGEGGFVNLMRIKSNYYRKIENILKKDIEEALKSHPKFRDELFDKLYSFFSRYFTESGSIYFNSTPFHNNIYEKVYTDEKDVILFWKTHMLYYVKTDRIFRSLPVEFPSERGVDAEGGRGVLKFYFDAGKIESKKANEKRSLIFELSKVREDDTIVFGVSYSEKGTKTKQDEILKAIKRKGIAITEDQLERAFRVFEKQSEVDFFINKNAKAFLQEQFKLWSYQYFWEGAKEWGADRVNQLQILKDIAFKIIDFISQFEDELVKIWNKPKFVKNSNYVITLDRITDKKLVEKIFKHNGIKEQIKEWQGFGIVDENSPFVKGWQKFPSDRGVDAKGGRGVPDGVVKWNELPFNPDLKKRAKELRKAGNLSEVLFWNQVKNKQFLGFDFDRQKIIGNYIVDFYCKDLGVVVEIDGVSHDSKIEYDKQRHVYLESLGLKVIHISDLEIKKNLSGVMDFLKNELKHPVPSGHPSEREKNTPSCGHPSTRGEYGRLPIDTKYFKDLEIEILSQFDDLDKSLDGWLIKSENYQALNTILPKFKEKVQTIYIDPPFNTGEDFDYVDRFQDSSWLSLMSNRLEKAKDLINKKGSLFLHLDYNANYYGRLLLNQIFGVENFRNEITWRRQIPRGMKAYAELFPFSADYILIFSKTDEPFWKPITKINKLTIAEAEKKYNKDEKGFFRTSDPGTYSFDSLLKLYEEGRLYAPYGSEIIIDRKNKIIKARKGNIAVKYYRKQEGNFVIEETSLDNIWNDIPGLGIASSQWIGFYTQKPEKLLQRVIESTSNEGDLVMDFFLGSGTTTAVAHKLGRKWIGVEMGEHFYSVVLPRMKKVLAYDKSGISKELKTPRQTSSDTPLKEGNYYEGGGFFKYYELEQYEEVLANCKYEDGDLFTVPDRSPYQEYVFMKDEKMLKALEIDYEKDKVKVDLSKLYPNIDIAETLSNLTGKWVKKISDSEVELEDGTKINTKDLDYKLIKSLIWWE